MFSHSVFIHINGLKQNEKPPQVFRKGLWERKSAMSMQMESPGEKD